jgi:hypothetical protein
MKLYPQLPTRVGSTLARELAVLPVREVEGRACLEHRLAIKTPTGGASATGDHLRTVQNALRSLGKRFGYTYGEAEPPPPLTDIAGFDLELARLLHQHLDLTPSEAARSGVWCFLGCCLGPELVRWRFPTTPKEPGTTAVDRFQGSRARNLYARMWWRGLLLRDPDGDDELWLIRELGEDQMVQLAERSIQAGWRPLNVVVGTQFLRFRAEYAGEVKSELLFREAMKRLLRRRSIVRFEALTDAQIQRAVADLFLETLQAQGVELHTPVVYPPLAESSPALAADEEALHVAHGELLNAPGEISPGEAINQSGPAPSAPDDRCWSNLDAGRRARLLSALTDDDVSALLPFVDKSLPDRGESEPRWKLLNQLDGTALQVLHCLGTGFTIPGVEDTAQWLLDGEVGSWASETHPRRAHRLVDVLRQPDMEDLFHMAGWPWEDGLTQSAAKRRFRREFNGSYEDVLGGLSDEAVSRLLPWPVDESYRSHDLRLSVIRWLLNEDP